MLRITRNDAPDRIGLKLEGKLAGAWVRELEECWRTAASSRNRRTVWVDLTGVDYVDTAGRYLLALMHTAGVRFVTRGCAMSALIEVIKTKGAA